jgi:hypothetical protein
MRVLHHKNGANDASGFDTSKNTTTQPAASENRQISGSPSGAPSPVHLSLRNKTLQQHRASNPAVKDAKSGHHHVTPHCNEHSTVQVLRGDAKRSAEAISS